MVKRQADQRNEVLLKYALWHMRRSGPGIPFTVSRSTG
nr:MAG TPA_asm: hypothetical protein [Caudoviricetes sp.]